jgi:hypothetical protein
VQWSNLLLALASKAILRFGRSGNLLLALASKAILRFGRSGKLLLALASTVILGSESRGPMTLFYCLTVLGAFRIPWSPVGAILCQFLAFYHGPNRKHAKIL